MKQWMNVMAAVVVVFALSVSAQATTYTVKKDGTAGYTTIDAAFEAALGEVSGSHTVLIQDSGVYDEQIAMTNGGTAGASVTVRPDTGQAPTVYAAQLWGIKADVTIQNFTFDGNLRDYTDSGSGRAGALTYLREAAADCTFKDCTMKGRGEYTTSYAYGATAGNTITYDGCTFESDSAGVVSQGISGQTQNGGTGDIVIKNNTFNGGRYGVFDQSWDPTLGTITVEHNIFNQTESGVYRRKNTSLTNMTVENNTFYMAGGTLDQWQDGAIVMRDFPGGDFGPVVLDNLIVGMGPASTDYQGLGSGSTAVSDINADYNGFWYMRERGGVPQVGRLGGTAAWKTLAELNAYLSAGNNLVGLTDPFVDAANGNFYLVAGSWAATAASDGSFIGALAAEETAAIPEPAALALLGMGLALRRNRRRR